MKKMAPKKKTLATKDKLLEAAQALMLAKGFVATSVDEICGEAGVTKGSFFHYFKSKEDLGKSVLEKFVCSTGEKMQSACCNAKDPLQRIYALLDCAAVMARDPEGKGCLIGTFAQEISETHPELRDCCAKSFKATVEEFRKDFSEAKAKYAPKADIDAEGLATCLLSVLQGSLLLIKATRQRGLMERNLKHFRNYLNLLFEK